MSQLENLQAHIKDRLAELRGPWVQLKNAYEPALCRALDFTPHKGRYWDATWGDYRIELKKGTSIWLDLVRYSEVLLKVNADAEAETLSLFCFPNQARDAVLEVSCVETSRLIETLRLDRATASFLVELNRNVPRQLNAQASLTRRDIKDIATFTVSEIPEVEEI